MTTETKTHQCNKCSKAFDSAPGLRLHQMRAHKGMGPGGTNKIKKKHRTQRRTRMATEEIDAKSRVVRRPYGSRKLDEVQTLRNQNARLIDALLNLVNP